MKSLFYFPDLAGKYGLVIHMLLDSLGLVKFSSIEFNKKEIREGVLSRFLSALFFCNEIALVLKAIYLCF